MIKLNIRTNFKGIAKQLDKLSDEVGSKAMVRALNKTIEQGRAQMARQIAQEFRIKVSEARARLAIRRAYAKGGGVSISATLSATTKGKGRSMNLIAFVRKAGAGKKRKQLKMQIKRTGGNKTITGAFIGNKGRTVFIRTTDKRLPIKSLSTIDIPQMFNTKRINEAVRKVMLDRFENNFNRELRVVLQGWNKR
jgi:hypothetical protein